MARIVTATAAASQAAHAAREGAREVAPWIVLLARVGYAAKGVVYLVIATLALRAALGGGGATTDGSGALRTIASGPLGSAALVVIGVGLLGYAVYALVAAATGADTTESGGKGALQRAGRAISGIAYGLLGVEALRLFTRARASSGGGGDAEHWTGRLLALPFGKALVIALALALAGYAVQQMVSALKGRAHRRLDLSGASATTRRAVERLATVGVTARSVVFLLVAWFLASAALRHDPQRAGGIDQALATVSAQPFGRVLLAVVALGLAAYGAFLFAKARWRQMRMA